MKAPIRSRFAAVIIGTAVVAVSGNALAQNRNFEVASAIPAARVAPPALLKGADYEVVDPVRVDRFLGSFELRSKFGMFRVSGVDMLALRVRELKAIEELKNVEGSSAFGDAVAKSAAAPVKLVGSLATDPGTTVENIATGAGTVLSRIGYSVKSGVQNAGDALTSSSSDKKEPKASADAAQPPALTDDPFGYNQARRAWAKKLDIDPYTSNPVLRPLLDDAARATFAGNFAVGLAVGAVAAPLGYATDFEATVKDSIWDLPPGDLAKSNEEKLKSMKVPAEVVRAFLRNRSFTPTLQTAFVAALDKLKGASGRDSVVNAASTIAGEIPARFLVRAVALLALQQRDTPIARVHMRGIVPIGKASDGTVVAAAAVDYLYWNEEAATFARAQELAGAKRVLLIQGEASARASEEFSRAGWKVRAGLRQATGG